MSPAERNTATDSSSTCNTGGLRTNTNETTTSASANEEARLRAILQTAIDGIITIDSRGVIDSFNPASERIFGFDADEVIGENVNILMPSPYRENHDAYIKNYLDSGNKKIIGIGREVMGRRKDGTTFPLYLGVGETKVAGKRFFTGIIRDLSAQKEAESAAKESRRALVTLISNLQGAVYRCKNDQDWTMEDVSDGIEALTGFAADDFIDNRRCSYGKVIHPAERDRVWQTVQAALAEQRPYQMEYRIVTAGGVEKWVWEHGCGIFAADSSLVALEGFITDISERKRGEVALDRTREDLMIQTLFTQRLSALATMAGGIAHELNQPLSGIKVYSETIRNFLTRGKAVDTTRVLSTLDKIIAQVDRASRVIDHMREFASDKNISAVEDLNVRTLVDGVTDMIGEQLRNHGIDFVNTVAPDVVIQINKTRFEQVLINLATNAKDSIDLAGNQGIRSKAIRITSVVDDDHVHVLVSDTGGGVPDTMRNNLLEPFVTTKGPDRGMGLGLSICHGILRDYGASIALAETSTKGATFRLTFPRVNGEKTTVTTTS